MTKQDILNYFKDINEAYNNCNKYDDLSRMLDELVENQSRWIPVDEALPSESGYYTVTVLYDDGERQMSDEFFDKNSGFSKYYYYKIIAWMPLPEPYQAESEEK